MLQARLLALISQILLSVLLFNHSPLDLYSATCTGSDPCHACKNCRYCRHCAREGGKCGVCK
jgi:hypothetical protein